MLVAADRFKRAFDADTQCCDAPAEQLAALWQQAAMIGPQLLCAQAALLNHETEQDANTDGDLDNNSDSMHGGLHAKHTMGASARRYDTQATVAAKCEELVDARGRALTRNGAPLGVCRVVYQ